MKTYPRLVVLTPGILVVAKDEKEHAAFMRRELIAISVICSSLVVAILAFGWLIIQ